MWSKKNLEELRLIKGINNILRDYDTKMYLLENGYLFKMTIGEFKLKYDCVFGWVAYIDNYLEEYESVMDNYYEKIQQLVYR